MPYLCINGDIKSYIFIKVSTDAATEIPAITEVRSLVGFQRNEYWHSLTKEINSH